MHVESYREIERKVYSAWRHYEITRDRKVSQALRAYDAPAISASRDVSRIQK